jgi:hypothetical protein
LEKEKSELALTAQHFDEIEQKHRHDMAKMQMSHNLKNQQKVVELDCSTLRKAKANKAEGRGG